MIDGRIDCERAIGRHGDQALRSELTNSAGDVLAKGERVLEVAIRVTQKDDIFDSQDVSCTALFLAAQSYQLFGAHCGVGRPFAPVCCYHVDELDAFGDPPGYCSSTAELGIIGVGKHYHRPAHLFMLLFLAHSRTDSFSRDNDLLPPTLAQSWQYFTGIQFEKP